MKYLFIWGIISILLAMGPGATLQAEDLTLMTLNCYCFDANDAAAVRAFKRRNLHEGVDTPPDVRIRKIAKLAIDSNSEILFFQELWRKGNKHTMINSLKSEYKFTYWNEYNTGRSTQADDGLLIASKRPPFFTRGIVFSDSMDEDSRARKGALFMGVCDGEGKPILLITTHLQSGGSWQEVDIRLKQCAEIVSAIKTICKDFPSIQGAQIIMAGDLNELVGWRDWPVGNDEYPKEKNRIIDRTKQLTDVFRLEGIPLSNDWLIKKMVANYGSNEILEVFQREAAAVIKDGKGTFKYTIHVKPGLPRDKAPNGSYAVVESAKSGERGTTASREDMDVVGYCNGKDHRWGVIPEATEPDSIQIIDHIFILEDRSVVKAWTVDRARFLGDRPNIGVYTKEMDKFVGRPLHKDPKTALTDHGAVFATISDK